MRENDDFSDVHELGRPKSKDLTVEVIKYLGKMYTPKDPEWDQVKALCEYYDAQLGQARNTMRMYIEAVKESKK